MASVGEAKIGELVYDKVKQREGVLMDLFCGMAYLRPRTGGREWPTPAQAIEPLDQAEGEER